ncbi:MAG: peptidoglycan DD-metalloendopeptidase family protein [Verrucomicrobiota bacterium]
MNSFYKTGSSLVVLSNVCIAASALFLCGAKAIADCVPAATEVGGDIPLRLPFRPGEHYSVTQGYCETGWDHSGYQVDFSIPAGTPIVACSAGTVVQQGTYSGNCTDTTTACGLNGLEQGGLFVKLQHPCSESGQAWYSSYLHFSVQSVTNGEHVEAGQTIGLSGNTGLSTGPHLHFHIRKGPADNPLNNPANHVGVRPTPMAGFEVNTGASPILTFTEGLSYQASQTPDQITNVMSAIVSYQYLNDLGSEGLTNGGLMSPVASYQYFEWPGNDVLQLNSSPLASYYYQYLNALSLLVVPTDRSPKTAETTPAIAYPHPTLLQLTRFEGGSFTSTPVFPPDLSKMAVVLTHGWNSNPDLWAKDMAALMVSRMGAAAPNIFAWDWRAAAQSGPCDPGTPESRTADEGAVLGQALMAKLGLDYAQPVHFVGSSLGTLVNAAAADYLHTTAAKGAGAYSPSKTHVTLFDEAEIAKDVHCTQFALKIGQLLTKLGNPLAPKTPSDHPLPKEFAWADNYVSAFGVFHENAANVLLTNGLPTSAPDFGALVDAITEFHGYPYRWYTNSIGDPAGNSALMGFRWSFEQNSLAPVPAVRTAFVQASSGSELDLVEKDYDEVRDMLKQRIAKFRSAAYSAIGQVAEDAVAVYGQVTTEVLTVGPPVGSGDAIMNWVVNLFTGGSGGGGLAPRPKNAGDGTNVPAYAWIPLVVPSNAVAMSFDFKIQGEWSDDYVAAALNGTNCLSLAGGRLETNVLLSSGPIDVVAMAGQTNEFFVGIVGGTSTNAQLTVQDVWFYTIAAPSLQTGPNGSVLSVSWPLSGQGFELQSTTNLSDRSSWAAVTNAPAIVDLQNMVTNAVSGSSMFYRLRKQ